MKTKLIFLVLLIVCYSCGTNNKPVSDAQKEKIKGEVKEVVNIVLKACEEINFEAYTGTWNDSPDFVFVMQGKTYGYKDAMALKPLFNSILSQKCTTLYEKYTILDNSTVLYTTDTKWSVNYKDGHATLEDPEAITIMFKKIDSKWKVTYFADSFVEKTIKYAEPSKEINQVELHKQFVGNWKTETVKDTTIFWDVKSYGTGFESNFKIVTKGKIAAEGKQLWGFDKNLDKYVWSEMFKGMDNVLYTSFFTSKNKCTMLYYSDISNPDMATTKWEIEFKSPDMFIQNMVMNNKIVKVDKLTRIK